jgi:hypothetical protein
MDQPRGLTWESSASRAAKITDVPERASLELMPDKITETLERLAARIERRFGADSGLLNVCQHLIGFSKDTVRVMDDIARPMWWLRITLGVLVVLMAVAAVYTVSSLRLNVTTLSVSDLVQVLEATTSELIVIGGGLFFLVSIETRVKRARVVDALNKLRAIAHIVDMKQLTKDPDSPDQTMTDLELGRYLDYCSELLSLISKIGVLYITRFDDPDATQSVNELEILVTGLSAKIWQKISIVQSRKHTDEASSVAAPVVPRAAT